MNWKLRGRVFGLVLLSVNYIAANAGYSVGPAQAGSSNPLKAAEIRASAMLEAQTDARKYLEMFLDHVLDENGMAQENAAIKIALTGYGHDDEYIWVSPFGIRDGRYVGLLANEPRTIDSKHLGDPVVFDADQVRDWYFFGDDGKMYGSYTTRAMLKEMSANSARQITQILSPTPVPAHW